MPQAEVPQVDGPQVGMPQAEVPQTEVPTTQMPQVDVPSARVPAVEMVSNEGLSPSVHRHIGSRRTTSFSITLNEPCQPQLGLPEGVPSTSKDIQDRKFLVANAQAEHYPIIYCNDGFCEMVGWRRAQLMQRSCICEFLHGPLTSAVAVQQIRDCLASCHEKQLEILYYKKDGSKFLCSQVTAPIRNEDGVISMFIVNFEDITNAPYRDAVVSPLPSPARILLNRFPALWRLIPRSRLKPGLARDAPHRDAGEDRLKKMRLKFSRGRTNQEDQELTVESPDSTQARSRSHVVTLGANRDQDSQSTRGDYASPRDCPDAGSDNSRSKQFSTTANHLVKSLPNASSDSDLTRFRYGSPSFSNDDGMPGVRGISGAPKENSQSSTTSKFLRDMQAHSKHHVGEKVAQLKILGKVALPLHQEPTWVSLLAPHLTLQHFCHIFEHLLQFFLLLKIFS
ncbi:potassium voltage-gated channel subfamily H member 2-like [Uloborus diversus]|uniref:potassium voltage-gated channel subfamily H member 2-like n=1 Tax=Uloborus diversus TaxID=327109 RepID=UPI00240A508E|nr:potassium voltage-gated channel subfamily H member 2-like [Uloborus diversus]